MMTRGMSLVMLAMTVTVSASVRAATLPAGFSEFAITGGNAMTEVTAMAFSPDGKLFVLEQGGTIEVYSGSGASVWTRLQADFFANAPLTVEAIGERGLLGIAFDPNYLANRFVYVYYTTQGDPRRNRIARYTANANGDLALAGSGVTLMNLDPLNATNHNGGAMHFGRDGKLYVAVGDNAVPANAQSIANRHGKILRLNPTPGSVIPSDNPSKIEGIAGTPTGANRAIWCAGLRNPFTFAFKPSSNLMYINDVGQSDWEEINSGKKGANYGWGLTEGPFVKLAFPKFRHPIVYYNHDDASLSRPANGPTFTGQTIIGGAFYLPQTQTFPNGYVGDYFFADFIEGWIRRYDPVTKTVHKFASDVPWPVAVLVGDDGAVYYLSRNADGAGSGRVFRVQRD